MKNSDPDFDPKRLDDDHSDDDWNEPVIPRNLIPGQRKPFAEPPPRPAED
ncbi:hypothetical protein [Streptomyces sp. NPDC049881]